MQNQSISTVLSIPLAAVTPIRTASPYYCRLFTSADPVVPQQINARIAEEDHARRGSRHERRGRLAVSGCVAAVSRLYGRGVLPELHCWPTRGVTSRVAL